METGDCRNYTVDVIIPTYHPGEKFCTLVRRLLDQSHPPQKIIVMLTEDIPADGSPARDEATGQELWEHGALGTSLGTCPRRCPAEDGDRYIKQALAMCGGRMELHRIPKAQFDHGGTRNLGVSFSDAEFFLMITDDAVPRDRQLLAQLLEAATGDDRIGCAYGRQVSGRHSSFDERLARGFNYPKQSFVKSQADLPAMGIKTYFQSNVCCLYRREVFQQLGGFPSPTIFNEDMIYCHKLLQAGYLSAYVAEAVVIHSHRYSGGMQFRRNFDLGVSQADHPEVFGNFRSEGEGLRMVRRGCRRLIREGQIQTLPRFLWISGCKWLGYRAGKAYRILPLPLVRRISMNAAYWESAAAQDTR